MRSIAVRRRVGTGLVAVLLGVVLTPVMAALVGAPVAKGDPSDPVPTVSIGLPSSALIGENVGFDISFWNASPSQPGYGPYIDLKLPAGDEPDNGLSFVGATYLGAAVTATQLTPDEYGCAPHPYAVDDTGSPVQICGIAADQEYWVLRLPFGSFTPGQPTAVVHVTTKLSQLANVGEALEVDANGGFEFGRTPINDPATDPSTIGDVTTADITPSIMTVAKSYNGPESETATGPDYPRSYTISVTVAPGQTVDDLTVTDVLPDTIQYISTDTPAEPFTSITEPSTTTPGGQLVIDFGSVTGSGGTDASATVNFYVPMLDAGGDPVLDPTTGAFNTSTDSVTAAGTWNPIDPDDGTDIAVTAGPATHTLNDKSIAVQKAVHKIGGGPVGPGDVLEWTIDVQVSDYFALDDVIVDDLMGNDGLGDGTVFDSSFTPTMAVTGNVSLPAQAMAAGDYVVSPTDGAGKTPYRFLVSDELINRGSSGDLIGNCVGLSGSSTPDCSAHSDGATTVQIVFHTIVQRTYVGGKQIVEGDTLANIASAYGDVLDTGTLTPTGHSIGDGGPDASPAGTAASISIQRGSLTKSIYAINGSTTIPNPVHVSPGDSVTYRLVQTFPDSRTDDFSITDFLPLPVFYATELVNGFDSASAPGTIPAAGFAGYGPSDTFHTRCSSDTPPDSCPDAPAPTVSTDSVANSVTFSYGDYALYPADSSVADILFTVKVSTDPFADGLLLTNQARSQTSNSVGTVVNADAIVQLTLDQPVLAITKGVVGTDNPAGVLTPDTTGTVAWTPVTAPTGEPTCPAFTDGPITNARLTGDPSTDPLDKDLLGADAADYVRFAVVVQDTGHAQAFNVQVKDEIPAGFVKPAGGFDMCITDGAGTAIGATNISDGLDVGGGDGLFDQGITLTDPSDTQGALAAGTSSAGVDNAAGTNIAIITYTLQVDTSAVPTSVITNTASLLGFTNDPTAQDHLAAPLTDDASVTLAAPAIDKVLAGTGQGNGTAVAIGEQVTYAVTLTIPEGTLPNASVVDALPAGMGFGGCESVSPSSDNVTTDVAGGFAYACANPGVVGSDGAQVTFDLGDVVNAGTDNATETIVITYDAVVLNDAGNVRGTSLQNGATLYWDDGGVPSVGPASAVAVVVHEPQLTIQKDSSTSSGDAFDSISYTVTISNPSSVDDPLGGDAFDVEETDAIPAGMTYDGSVPFAQDPGGPSVSSLTVVDGVLDVKWDEIAQGQTAVLRYSVTVDSDVAPSATLPNTANLTWTSLPGSLSGERTGNVSDPGGSLNDYTASDGAEVDVPAASAAKSILATDQASTSGDNVTVGEVVTYQVVLTIPEGVALNSQLTDTLPAGMAFVGCDSGYPIAASSGVTTDLPGGWADACDTGQTLQVANSGRDLTFGLGDVTNANVNSHTPATITVTYDAVVLDVAGNVRGTTLHNGAAMSWQDAGSNTYHSNTAAAPDVTVVEPLMTVTKSASKTTGDAGDTITFTVTVANPTDSVNHHGTDAFDVAWTDTLPSGLDYSTASYSIETTTCDTAPDSGPTAAGQVMSATWTDFPEGGSCTIQYQATLASDVPSGSSYTNDAVLTWTSLPGVHNTLPGPSSYSDYSTERTGSSSDPGGAANDYLRTSSVTVSVPQPAPVKSVVATSEPGTAGTVDVEIGEIVRYQVYVVIPEGVTNGVSIRDTLSPGLTYLNDGSTTIAFVANQTGMTSTAVPDGDPESALYVDGNETWPLTPTNHPTYVMPAGAIGGGSGGAGALNGFQPGDDPVFDFGTMTNADSDADSELVVIEFNVLVDNVIGNQNGTNLTDRASIWADPPLPAPQTPVKLQDSNGPLAQTVVEPDMTLTKTISTAPIDAGDTIVYHLAAANSSATAPAYDYEVLDTMPAALVSPPSSVDVSCASGAYTDNSAGSLIDVTFSQIDPSTTCTIDVTTTVGTTEPAGETFTNAASAAYSSLPGLDGTDAAGGNATGSTHSGDSGTATGERTGSDGLGGLNDYVNSSQVDQTLAAPSIVKYAPSPASAPIGAETTFDIVVTLPEGTTRGLTVTDTLQDGLDFVSATPVTSGGRLGADFSGTFTDPDPTPVVTAPDGSHEAYALTFGDTTVPVDGIAGNEQFEVQVTVRVANVTGNVAGTALWNSARVTYTDGATPVDVAAPSPQEVTVLEPDLRLTKSVSSTTPYFGATLTYTLTLSHGNGAYDVDAHDVTLVDTLPVAAGWTYAGSLDASGCADADGGTPSYAGGVITTTFATFPLGHTCTITYQATVGVLPNAHLKDAYTNTAVAAWTSLAGPSDYERTGNTSDPGGALNDYSATKSATATVTGVDLYISKDDGTTTATAAQLSKYTITYQNNGNVTATGVVITETVPANTTFNSAQSTGSWLNAGGGACANGSAAGTVCHLNVGSLAPMPGNSGSKIFAVTVVDPIPSGQTQVVNTATIADDGTHLADANLADNTTTDTDSIPQADLSLTKSVDVSRPGQNKPVVYTITLTNSGPSDATSVQVKDLLPAGITYSSYSATQGTYSSGTGIWTITGTVANGTSKILTIHATATGSNTATNVAEVTHSADGDPDSTPNNHVTTEDDYATAQTQPLISDMAVTKTADNSHPDEGSNVTFTITATNNGPDDATGAKVTDTLPAGLTFVSATPSVGSWAGNTWTIGSLANGGSATLSLVAHVASAGSITNTATASSDSFDTTPGNNSASATVSQTLDLAVSKSVDNPTPNVGGSVTFTVGVTNSGLNAAHNVVIHDALPAGLTFVSATPSQGSYSSATGNWTVGTVATSGSASMTVTATVAGHSAMTNTASVGSLDETQTSTANDSATATVTPTQADLAVTKTVDDAGPEIGDTINFTVGVDNIGPDTATNVALHDALPAGLTFVSATPSQGSYTSTTGVWTVGTLAKNATATMTVAATVTAGGTYTNTASVSACDQYDPVSSNNSASVDVTSRMADIGVAKSVDNPTPNVGGTVNYTVTVTNNGPDQAKQLVVKDLLPAGLSLVAATPSQGSYTAATGLWSIGSLADAGQVTLSISAKVVASGEIDNTAAFYSMLETDSNPANNSATATLEVTTAADLEVTKTASTNRPDVGSDVTFTVTATDNGPDDATGVSVADALPAGLSLVSATPAAGTSYSSGTWTIGNLANGDSKVLTIVATVESPGAITNTATISGDEYDPVAANDTASTTVDQRVDLVVAKSASPTDPNAGANATFTLQVSNTGPNTANHVVIRDLLPAGLTYVSDDSGGAYDPATGDWTVGSIGPSGSATLKVVATVEGHDPVTNTASVLSVDETQSDTTNDSASATVTPPWADLEVTKTVDNSKPDMGDHVTFTIKVDNLGPDDATNVVVSDALPAGLTWVSDDGLGAYDPATGDWTVGSLADGATATLDVTASVDARGDYTNTATVSHSDQYDPVPDNNTDSAFLTTRQADIAVTKTVDDATPAVGAVVEYTITATNDGGPDPASGLVIHDALPSGKLTFVSASADTGTYDAVTGDWTVGNLAVGATATLKLDARVIDSGKIDNTASVGSLLQRDSNPDNDSATVEIDAPPAADLSLTKTVDDDTPDKDSTVTFTLTVTNSGPNDTTGVVVTDTWPAGLTYVSDDGGDPSDYDPASGKWTVGDLNAGAHATLHISATVDVGNTQIVNTAEVTASDLPDPDSTPGNGVIGEDDEASVALNARGVADLAIAKTVTPSKVTKGQRTTYKLVVTNNGPDGATGVVVSDQLPSSVTFVSSTGGDYDSKTGAWNIGSLADGDSATLEITVVVGKTGAITNTADIVAADQRDPDPSNGEATAGISAAAPSPPITVADQGPLSDDPGSLILWLLAFAFAVIALLGSVALASRNHRLRLRR